MAEVNITIGDRSFKLGCDDGEEQHLLVLAEHLGKQVEKLRASVGKTGDEQLYLMAGLMICDELWDARDELAKLESSLSAPKLKPMAVAPLSLPVDTTTKALAPIAARVLGAAQSPRPMAAPSMRPGVKSDQRS